MKILKTTLLNYLKGLKFLFTPIGILTLFLVIGFSIAIPGIINSVKGMVEQVSTIVYNTKDSINWEVIGGDFYALAINQDWSDPSSVLANFFSTDYLKEQFFAILQKNLPELKDNVDTVKQLIEQCIAEIAAYLAIIIGFFLLGFVVGFFVTSYQVKREITHRPFWKFVVFAIFDTVLYIFAIWLSVRCLIKLSWGIWLVLVILLVLGIISLIEGWLIHGVKKVPLKKIFNFKNFIFLIISNILLIGTGFGLIMLVSLIGMPAVTILLGIAFFEVTQAVLVSNAEGYAYYITHDEWFKVKSKEIVKAEKAVK